MTKREVEAWCDPLLSLNLDGRDCCRPGAGAFFSIDKAYIPGGVRLKKQFGRGAKHYRRFVDKLNASR
jgi:hypothetical protein